MSWFQNLFVLWLACIYLDVSLHHGLALDHLRLVIAS